jgi:hypothetical protein
MYCIINDHPLIARELRKSKIGAVHIFISTYQTPQSKRVRQYVKSRKEMRIYSIHEQCGVML